MAATILASARFQRSSTGISGTGAATFGASTGSPRIPTTRVYQYGPACVRDSRDLKAALATLTERGRARLEEEGRRRFVVVNPALLDG